MNFIGQILPVDGYIVSQKETLPVDYAKSLTHLYQPLLGIKAVALYQTLLHDIDLNQEQAPQTHHTLMNYLDLPLDEIFQARLKLEGIGLLKTYKQNWESSDLYTYELQSPFAPSNFFKDAMLSQLLYHHLGDQKFELLKNYYGRQTTPGYGVNITAAFSEVFQTFTPSAEILEVDDNRGAEPKEDTETTDFTWIEQMLKQRMVPHAKVLTTENRRLISQMMVLYELDTHEIDKSLLWALNDENRLDTEEFKTACHDLFKAKNNQKPIRLAKKVDVSETKQISDKPKTKEEILVERLETMSPKQLLEDLSNGNHASEQDMKAIRDVMTTQGLPGPVMNVLIHYVLLQTNMKLSKAYLEKIASHWSRANIQTAKEAMVFAKKEQASFQNAVKRKTAYNKKPVSKEVIPDWFKDRKHKQETQPAANQNVVMTEEQKRIAARLRQYSNGN
ncbi:replication initiation and membrane attachment family protein [Oceanobacillus profundus]|uniref:Chromosome replication initiation protein n=1 Tax=Oceanobacillus profundus TaxID=372463 RepID=A0A417YIR3_9BACI|nr:DnaD domain protein [Oceanobacillus profundus]MCM3400210.1 DnaD domain protein [Oceanobacillus profundus]PAE30896.1 chromosome replication initiation protein [Paenibacillus sp. 7884-2]RHW32956.1 chromosome replication initiation protein [Oceanobacillus profundus]